MNWIPDPAPISWQDYIVYEPSAWWTNYGLEYERKQTRLWLEKALSARKKLLILLRPHSLNREGRNALGCGEISQEHLWCPVWKNAAHVVILIDNDGNIMLIKDKETVS